MLRQALRAGLCFVMSFFLLTGTSAAFGNPAPQRVLCSGPGCLRLLTYLQAQDRIVGVEDIEKRHNPVDPRPYFLAHPEFAKLPLIGEFRGFTRPELVLSLEPFPQVIFKTYPDSGTPAAELAEMTGVPVVPLQYGNLGGGRSALYASLRTMAGTLGREDRAEEVIAFMESIIADLKRRTKSIPEARRPSCFIGGVAYRGPHGVTSTEKGYPPFRFVDARDALFGETPADTKRTHADVSRENLLQADPEYLFIDLSTVNAEGRAGAIRQLQTDPLWQDLRAIRRNRVYGVLPYNWYTQNFGSILANAYFIGKTLYPEAFRDVDPEMKADEIFSFLVGQPVFAELQSSFRGLAFRSIPLKED